MLVEVNDNIVKEFYDVVASQRVLVLVAFDVDAVCAAKILQYLFQCDHVSYTLIPVTGKQDLETAYNEHSEQIKCVVMINCGANLDVVEFLQPEEDVMFFIIDSHRPMDVYNVHSAHQVRLLIKSGEDDNIPALEDFYRENDSEDDSGHESDDSVQRTKRQRFDEANIEKRRARRLWEEKRAKILFDYTQFSSYGTSSSILMFNLAWKMSKDNNDLLWWSIVGLTEQFLNGKIEQDKYVLDCGDLQAHVTRLNHRDDNDNNVSVNCVKIAFGMELGFALFRHWSLFESIRHTMYTACKFKLWTLRGVKKLSEFLADLGLPLAQVKQKYQNMDILLRENIKGWIEEKAEKYGLEKLVYGSFHVQHGFRHKFCAADVVYSASALLESVARDKFVTDCFHNATDSLSRSNVALLHQGFDCAKQQMVVIFKQVQLFLDTSQVISAGPFLYAVVPEGAADAKFFSFPGCLMHLARFLLCAQITVSRNKKARKLPLILSAPYAEEEGMSILVGIPPVPISEDSPKNFFGKAFEQASQKTRARTNLDYFESSTILIYTEDRSKFFDALITILS